MVWEVEYTDEFGEWWDGLALREREAIATSVSVLQTDGPLLAFPRSSGLIGSKFGHMRELRIQSAGRPIRVIYAFDPRRIAILLIGGEKTGDDRWYARMIPIADMLYVEHLRTLRMEGDDDG